METGKKSIADLGVEQQTLVFEVQVEVLKLTQKYVLGKLQKQLS